MARSGAGPRSFDDVAVLYRTRRQADILERCLSREGIPCTVAGRDDFLMEPEVRGALCFLRLLADPGDVTSLRGGLRLSWRCPADVAECAVRVWTQTEGSAAERSEAAAKAYPREPVLSGLAHLCRAAGSELEPLKLLDLWTSATETGGLEAIERLKNMAVFFKGVEAFLEHLALGREGDLLRRSGRGFQAGAVRLMTLHGSKGLEFPVVFVCGVRKGKLPLESEHRPADLEEERRLFYVGITRAKEELILLTSGASSAFLEEIPRVLLQEGRTAPKRHITEGKQLSLF